MFAIFNKTRTVHDYNGPNEKGALRYLTGVASSVNCRYFHGDRNSLCL